MLSGQQMGNKNTRVAKSFRVLSTKQEEDRCRPTQTSSLGLMPIADCAKVAGIVGLISAFQRYRPVLINISQARQDIRRIPRSMSQLFKDLKVPAKRIIRIL